jgi:hypothetical protein
LANPPGKLFDKGSKETCKWTQKARGHYSGRYHSASLRQLLVLEYVLQRVRVPTDYFPHECIFFAQTPTEYNRFSSMSRASNGPQADPNRKRQGNTPLMTICSATTPLGWEGKTGTPGQARKNLHPTTTSKGGGMGQRAHLAKLPSAGTGQGMGATGPHTREDHWRPPLEAQYLD